MEWPNDAHSHLQLAGGLGGEAVVVVAVVAAATLGVPAGRGQLPAGLALHQAAPRKGVAKRCYVCQPLHAQPSRPGRTRVAQESYPVA